MSNHQYSLSTIHSRGHFFWYHLNYRWGYFSAFRPLCLTFGKKNFSLMKAVSVLVNYWLIPSSPIMHPRPPRRHIGDRQLTTNFEFWVEIFLCADMFPCDDFKTVSVCLYPEKRNHPGFVNISPTLVIDTSMERSSRVPGTAWKPNFFFFKFEIEFWLVPESWNR